MGASLSTHITALHGFLGQPSDFAPLQKNLKAQNIELQALNLNQLKIPLDQMDEYLYSQQPPGFDRYYLLGYSQGGRLALEALRSQVNGTKKQWNGFIFISTNPGLQNENEKAMRHKNDLNWGQKILSLEWNEFIKQWNSQEVFTHSQEPARVEVNYSKETLVWQLDQWSLARQSDSWRALQDVNIPVLWLSGERDKKFCLLSEQLNGPCLKKILVPHSGHRVIFDNSDELFYSINHWL